MIAKKEGYLDLAEIHDLVKSKGTPENYSGWGIVVDVTWPYKTEHSEDFFVKMKVVDPTLYPSENEDKKFLYLFVFHKDKDALPICTKLGLIVKFKRFKFKVFEETKEVRGTYYSAFSSLEIYENDPNIPPEDPALEQGVYYLGPNSKRVKEQHTGPADLKFPLEDKAKRLQTLRDWSRSFFLDHSLLSMSWMHVKESIKGEFDLLVIVKTKVDEVNSTLILTDKENNKYELIYKFDYTQSVREKDVIKIRSVRDITRTGELVLMPYASLVVIPDFFFDARSFVAGDATPISKKLHEQEVLSNSVRYNVERFDLLQRFEISYALLAQFAKAAAETDYTPKIASAITKRFNTLPGSTLKELLKVQAGYTHSGESVVPTNLEKYYRVRGYIIDLRPKKLVEIARKYCGNCKSLYDAESNVTECCNIPTKHIFNFCLYLKDSSIDAENSVFESFVSSIDENPNYFFPNICLDKGKFNEGDVERFDRALTKIANQVNYLYDFVLQPAIKDNKQVIFRIVDTILLVT